MNKLWEISEEQKFTSKSTSINSSKMPATIKFIDHWDRVDVCLDIGGGRFSNVADYLGSIGVSYYNYDPYNQSYEQNLNAVEHCSNGRSDLVMINNVLNVIQDKQGRCKVLMQAHNACHAGATVYTLIYEGDKTGVGKSTGRDKWQENARTATYMDMHSQFFGDVKKIGNFIVSKLPKKL